MNEIDAIRLFSLAIKAANNSNSNSISTNESTKENDNELDKNSPSTSGGGLFSSSSSAKSINKMSNIDLKPDVELQEKIKKVLDEESTSCESKSDRIMNLIFEYRKKKIVEKDRENIPPAQARLILEGGGSDPQGSSTLPTQQPNDPNSPSHHPIDNSQQLSSTDKQQHDVAPKKPTDEPKNNQKELTKGKKLTTVQLQRNKKEKKTIKGRKKEKEDEDEEEG